MVSTVARQIAVIRKSAEKMVASEPATIGEAAPGDVVRQGDLYLISLDREPHGKVIMDRQLAPGTTQGSRHVAEGDCELRSADAEATAKAIKRLTKADVPVELLGPSIVCRGATTIAHPEHGHRTLPAGTSWAVVYQRQYAEEVRRVQD